MPLFARRTTFGSIAKMRSAMRAVPKRLSKTSSSSSSVSIVNHFGPTSPNGEPEKREEVELRIKNDEANQTGNLRILQERQKHESVETLAIASKPPRGYQPRYEDVASGLHEEQCFEFEEKLLQLRNLEYDLDAKNAKFQRETAEMEEQAKKLRVEVADLKAMIWGTEE